MDLNTARCRPSWVMITGPAEKMILPVWYKALLIKVKIRKMLIGSQPVFSARKGTVVRQRIINARIAV